MMATGARRSTEQSGIWVGGWECVFAVYSTVCFLLLANNFLVPEKDGLFGFGDRYLRVIRFWG